jgi:pimeloyl-ACP methyl ester carboxylesterase
MTQPSTDLLHQLAAARGIPVSARPPPLAQWFTASDGARLHYLDWPGAAEPMILLHGGMLCAHTFDLFVLALGPEVRCVALDLRGHGRSDWAESYSIDRWVADLRDLVEHLAVPRVHLVGMSLGGCVAGHAAAELGATVASLTFIDVGAEVSFGASARMRGFFETVRPAATVEDVVGQALALSPHTDPGLMLYRYQALLVEQPEGYVWKADRRQPTDFDHILGKLADLSKLAAAISCPVMVVKGGRSRVLTDVTATRFAGRFAGGRWALIPGAGHNIQEDAPVALATLVADLIGLSPGHVPREASPGRPRETVGDRPALERFEDEA